MANGFFNKTYEEGDIIDDDEAYMNSNDNKTYSHQALIMMAIQRVIDAGTKEMRAGYWNLKYDKFGNETAVYVEDTRKAFIECVKNVMMLSVPLYDEECKPKIKEIKEKIDDRLNYYLELEYMDWNNASPSVIKYRNTKGMFKRIGYLSSELPYYNDYLGEIVDYYREIFETIQLLLYRIGYGEEVINVA